MPSSKRRSRGIIVSQDEKAFSLLSNGPDSVDAADPVRQHTLWPAFTEIWRSAKEIADRESFLHWEVAFPGVWHRWQDDDPVGGFDAVIGNPPWDRIKLQESEWFGLRKPEIAEIEGASEREAAIQELRERDPEFALEFEAAKEHAQSLSTLSRETGHFPLLGGGDINLYSLFVERSMHLIKPNGIVGLIIPSGIYADKTASSFFKLISTGGRVDGLFDFENKKIFFKDVHSSQKFCAFIFGGDNRFFEETKCAFFLHDTDTIQDEHRCFSLSAADFARVNPNTNTAPIFCTRRDADLTRSLYEQYPVLVDRSTGQETKVWPIKYRQGLFHSGGHSGLFRRKDQLQSKGFYPVKGSRWKRGDELYVPLYEGKMVQMFDHRAASIVINEKNIVRKAQP